MAQQPATEKELLRLQIQAYEFYSGLIDRAVTNGAHETIMPKWDEQRALEYMRLGGTVAAADSRNSNAKKAWRPTPGRKRLRGRWAFLARFRIDGYAKVGVRIAHSGLVGCGEETAPILGWVVATGATYPIAMALDLSSFHSLTL